MEIEKAVLRYIGTAAHDHFSKNLKRNLIQRMTKSVLAPGGRPANEPSDMKYTEAEDVINQERIRLESKRSSLNRNAGLVPAPARRLSEPEDFLRFVSLKHKRLHLVNGNADVTLCGKNHETFVRVSNNDTSLPCQRCHQLARALSPNSS